MIEFVQALWDILFALAAIVIFSLASIYLFGCDANAKVFYEDVVQPFVEWWKNPWNKPKSGGIVPQQHSPSRYNVNRPISSHQPLTQTPPPKDSSMLINGTPIDHLSQDEENFLTFAFGKMVDGKPEVTIDDPLFKYVERKVNPVSPFLLWPDKFEMYTATSNNQSNNITDRWFQIGGLLIGGLLIRNGGGVISINKYWELYPELAEGSTNSPEEKISLLNTIATDKISSNAVALRYLSKDAATAKQLLLANVGKVCKEMASGDNRDGSTSYNVYSRHPDNGTPRATNTSTRVIVGALLGIGGQELAMAMLLTSGDFHVQGLVQQWIGVFGAKD